MLMSTTLGNNYSVKWSYYSIRYFKPKSPRKTTTYNKHNIPDISSFTHSADSLIMRISFHEITHTVMGTSNM
jgi:hypothetical protein